SAARRFVRVPGALRCPGRLPKRKSCSRPVVPGRPRLPRSSHSGHAKRLCCNGRALLALRMCRMNYEEARADLDELASEMVTSTHTRSYSQRLDKLRSLPTLSKFV